MMKFDIIVNLIARKKLFHPCKIGWTLYGTRLVSYNADRVSANVIIYGRQPAPERIWPGKKKICISVRCTGDYQIAGDLQIVEIVRRQCYM